MVAIELIFFALCAVCLVWVFATQIIFPIIARQPIFPMLDKRHKLEEEIHLAYLDEEIAKREAEIVAIKKKASGIREKTKETINGDQ